MKDFDRVNSRGRHPAAVHHELIAVVDIELQGIVAVPHDKALYHFSVRLGNNGL